VENEHSVFSFGGSGGYISDRYQDRQAYAQGLD
jgi:hypothetical protein